MNELPRCQVTVCKDLEQHVIDNASDQWRCWVTACVSAKGRQFKHSL